MRIVLDTNVFISGIFFTGPPYQILKAWRDGKVVRIPADQIEVREPQVECTISSKNRK